MNLAVYIARRYLFSKKSNSVINIISAISMVGIAVCSMALVIVLSAFNGIEQLVGSLYDAFDSDLRITLKEGKTWDSSTFPEEDLRKIQGVRYYTQVIEESVGLQFDNQTQAIATIKGVQDDYLWMNGLDTMMVEGDLVLQEGEYPMMVLGRGIKNKLGVQVDGFTRPGITVFAPLRGKSIAKHRQKAFNSERIQAAGVFSVNVELDMQYVLVPIEFASEILAYGNEISAVEIGLDENAVDFEVKQEVLKIVGDDFEVRTRYEQNALIYETTKTEKWITFMILSLILLIAAFNLVASLTMLVLEKKQDIQTLMAMGATRSLVRNIFFTEGMLINVFGGVGGILLGLLLCWLQQSQGLIRLENSIVEFYPIKMLLTDFLAVLGIVLMIGGIASWFPVRFLTRKHLGTQAD